MAKDSKNPKPEIDGANVIMDGRMAALRDTNEKDLLQNARAAKKYAKGK